MNPRHPSPDEQHQPGDYAIRIAGHINPRWSAWFDGLEVRHEPDGTTTISGPVVDQAALHGLLRKVRDLSLPLISVIRNEPEHTTDARRTPPMKGC